MRRLQTRSALTLALTVAASAGCHMENPAYNAALEMLTTGASGSQSGTYASGESAGSAGSESAGGTGASGVTSTAGVSAGGSATDAEPTSGTDDTGAPTATTETTETTESSETTKDTLEPTGPGTSSDTSNTEPGCAGLMIEDTPPQVCSELGPGLEVVFINECEDIAVDLMWVNWNCVEEHLETIPPGGEAWFYTEVNHVWRIRNAITEKLMSELDPLEFGDFEIPVP